MNISRWLAQAWRLGWAQGISATARQRGAEWLCMLIAIVNLDPVSRLGES